MFCHLSPSIQQSLSRHTALSYDSKRYDIITCYRMKKWIQILTPSNFSLSYSSSLIVTQYLNKSALNRVNVRHVRVAGKITSIITVIPADRSCVCDLYSVLYYFGFLYWLDITSPAEAHFNDLIIFIMIYLIMLYYVAFIIFIFIRQIECEEDEENIKLQQCWVDLLNAIKCIYRDNRKCLSENGGTLHRDKCKNHVSR